MKLRHFFTLGICFLTFGFSQQIYAQDMGVVDEAAVEETEAVESGKDVAVGQKIGGVNLYLAKVDPNSINFFKYMKLESSIPAWQKILDETPYAFSTGMMLIGMGLGIGILAFALFQIYSVFDIIKKEDSPFSDKVLKKLLIALITVDVILALTTGIGQAAIGGLITWAVYAIMDYGRLLQTQSDETL